MRSTLLGALAATVLFSGTAQAGAGLTSLNLPLVYFNPDNQDFSIGWGFATTGQTITALGYNDYGFTSPHSVGLYDDGGVLLASVVVTDGGTALNHFRYVDLAAPLMLGAGNYFIMGTTLGAGDGFVYQVPSFTTNAATTYSGSYFASGFGGNLAAPTNAATADRQYLAVNFLAGAVPEPASWAMMIGGFALAGTAMRHRQSQSLRFV